MFRVHTPIIRSIRCWVVVYGFLHQVYGRVVVLRATAVGRVYGVDGAVHGTIRTVNSFINLAYGGLKWSALCHGCLTSEEEPLIPSQQEVGWASQPVSVHCKKEKPFLLLGIKPRFLCHPACSLATILTTLSWVKISSQQISKYEKCQGSTNPKHQSAQKLNFVQWHCIFMGPQMELASCDCFGA